MHGFRFSVMAGRQAKILLTDHVKRLLSYASRPRHPRRNRVIVLLSAKAGLRAGEIANLTWPMVTDPVGRIGIVIALEDRVAKKKSGRIIPLHPDLRDALGALRATEYDGPVVRSERGMAMTPTAIVNWFTL